VIEERLRTFIVEDLSPQVDVDGLTDDYPLLANGVLDSVGIFEVVSFAESEFGIRVEHEELVPANFSSIRAVAALIRSKVEAGGRDGPA
jgi:acyl carrier protein